MLPASSSESPLSAKVGVIRSSARVRAGKLSSESSYVSGEVARGGTRGRLARPLALAADGWFNPDPSRVVCDRFDLDVAPVPGPDDALPKQAQGGSGWEWVVVGLVGVSRAVRGGTQAGRRPGGGQSPYVFGGCWGETQ